MFIMIYLIIYIVCLQCFNKLLIFVQALRKLNFILGKMPANLKKNMKMATSQEASDIQYVMLASHFLSTFILSEFEIFLFVCLFVFTGLRWRVTFWTVVVSFFAE